MPTRSFTSNNGGYRFAFNGQEQDNELKGNGNSLAFKYRIYDARLGKFLSVDPLVKEYPWYSPYHFAGNTPIWAMELEGLEPEYTSTGELVYRLKSGDGFTHAQKELAAIGLEIDWKLIRDHHKNIHHSKDITIDRDNPNNPQYRDLNMNTGEVLYIGLYTIPDDPDDPDVANVSAPARNKFNLWQFIFGSSKEEVLNPSIPVVPKKLLHRSGVNYYYNGNNPYLGQDQSGIMSDNPNIESIDATLWMDGMFNVTPGGIGAKGGKGLLSDVPAIIEHMDNFMDGYSNTLGILESVNNERLKKVCTVCGDTLEMKDPQDYHTGFDTIKIK